MHGAIPLQWQSMRLEFIPVENSDDESEDEREQPSPEVRLWFRATT